MGHGAQSRGSLRLLDLQSPRFRAGHWQDLSAADLELLFAPEVTRWLPGGFHGLADDAARRQFLEAMSGEAETVALFADGWGIGLLILSYEDTGRSEPGRRPTRHIGYLLAQHVWGQGYASALLQAVQALFRGSGTIISGGVMDENAASARVLEKAGFRGSRNGAETTYCWDSCES